ncbi:two-component system, OmpR family, sensor histidine kinase MprB [Nakamurella panacisegetis]|uniref:histidine kinase n=1 Tax=Nakamurella panacisegetis TaxID=1090615 RepID=A0A1H0REB2_9ACTN|nr:HAMP domain-containing sensor histidine kinase [Nakamurella panacisegetis]SDP27519.1 two-component system, OmpR family, sensor histidine kinase MprB [Nakamurella panacisegetis]
MTLRQKFVAAFAAVAAVVAVTIGWVAYGTTEHALHNEINVSLVSAVSTLAAGGSLSSISLEGTQGAPGDQQHHGDGPSTMSETAQSVSVTGAVTHLSGVTVALPVSPRALQIAQGSTAGLRTIDQVVVGNTTYQVLTQSLGGTKGAVQVGRDLNEAARVLRNLAVVTVLVALAVLLVAGAAGWWLARRLTRRLTALTSMAETVGQHGSLDVAFAMPGRDEVGRLSSSLQSMVGELSRSKQAQQRLVQNAGHELRTPLTSLRTNVSVLRRLAELSPNSRQRLLDDVDGETRELTNLVNELVELAMDRRDTETAGPINLTALAKKVAAMFEHRSKRPILVHADTDTEAEAEAHVMIIGRPRALERAISNLLDNALKFDTGGGPVDLRITGDRIEVSDRGPGISLPDATRIFDRFYRADTARSMPGSGLGLAIVAEVAAAHGGASYAQPRPGGGARIGFTLGAETFLPNSNPQPAIT